MTRTVPALSLPRLPALPAGGERLSAAELEAEEAAAAAADQAIEEAVEAETPDVGFGEGHVSAESSFRGGGV